MIIPAGIGFRCTNCEAWAQDESLIEHTIDCDESMEEICAKVEGEDWLERLWGLK